MPAYQVHLSVFSRDLSASGHIMRSIGHLLLFPCYSSIMIDAVIVDVLLIIMVFQVDEHATLLDYNDTE